jgi:hypothetical protein
MNIIIATCAAALQFVSLLILLGGRDPDTHFGGDHLLATVLVFIVWSVGILGWGRFLAKKLRADKIGVASYFALGTAFASVSAMFLGHLQVIGPNSIWIFSILIYVGIIFGWKEKPKFKSITHSVKNEKAAWILGFLLALVVVMRMIKGLVPWGQSDPLFYQLYAPRLWLDHGGIYFPIQATVTFLSGSWEYLHLWGLRLLSTDPGRGLIEGQIFSQLTHVLFGYGGTALIVFAFSRKVLKLTCLASVASAVAALTVRDLLWVSYLAKNDWGNMLWIFTGVIFLPGLLNDPDSDPFFPWIAGFFLGLGFTAKFSQGFFIGLVMIAAFYFNVRKSSFKKSLLDYWKVVLALIFAASPILLRNLIFTGNPVFPFKSATFGTASMSSGLMEQMRFYEQNTYDSFQATFSKIGMLFYPENPQLITLALSIPLLFISKKSKFLIPLLLSALVSCCVLYSAGGRMEQRHLGPVLIVFAIVSVAVIELLMEKFALAQTIQKSVLFLFAAYCLFQADIIQAGRYSDTPLIEAPGLVLNGASPDQRIRSEHVGGAALAWLRMNAEKTDRVVTTGDSQLYYASVFDISSVKDNLELSATAQHINDGWVLIQFLQSKNVRYLLDSRTATTQSELSGVIDPVILADPSSIVFRDRTSLILDLNKVTFPGAPKIKS